MKETRAEHLAVEKLRPFEGHPFKVVDNEKWTSCPGASLPKVC